MNPRSQEAQQRWASSEQGLIAGCVPASSAEEEILMKVAAREEKLGLQLPTLQGGANKFVSSWPLAAC